MDPGHDKVLIGLTEECISISDIKSMVFKIFSFATIFFAVFFW